MGRTRKRQLVPSPSPSTLPPEMQGIHSPSPSHPPSPSPTTLPPTMQGIHSPSPTHPHLFSPSSDYVAPPLQFNPYISGSSVSRVEPSPEPGSNDTRDTSELPIETYTDDGKIVLTIEGDGFLPSHPAANGISVIIKSHYIEAWPSWKKIPPEVVDMWFNEFLSRFSISPPDHKRARKIFVTRGSSTLSNILHKARSKKPNWMPDLVWEKLHQHWESNEFKKKSAQAKLNRASDCGGLGPAKHTCGSITSAQHKINLAQRTGVVPSPSSLFLHTHQHKKDKQWVDERSKIAYEKFTSNLEVKTQLAAYQGVSPPNELDVWCDTVGVKKGRIYGLASELTVMSNKSDKHESSSSTAGLVQKDELEKLVKGMDDYFKKREDYWKDREDYWSDKVKEVEAERDDLRTRLENTEKLVQTIQERLNSSGFGSQQIPGFQPHPTQYSASHPDRALHQDTTATNDHETNGVEEERTNDLETPEAEEEMKKTKRRRTVRRGIGRRI